MRYEVDLTAAEEPRPIPTAVVVSKALSVEDTVSSNNNKMFRISAEVQEPGSLKGKKWNFQLTLTESNRTQYAIRNFIESCGCKLLPGSFDMDDTIGKTFGASVALDISPEYGARNNPKKFFLPGERVPKQFQSEEEVTNLIEANELASSSSVPSGSSLF